MDVFLRNVSLIYFTDLENFSQICRKGSEKKFRRPGMPDSALGSRAGESPEARVRPPTPQANLLYTHERHRYYQQVESRLRSQDANLLSSL